MQTCNDCIHCEVCVRQKIYGEYSITECKGHFLGKEDVVEIEKVAEMFAEQFGDKCPCNFNDNDEWLPYVCEHTNTCDCPCKDGWNQFIKHYGNKRSADNGN